MIFDVSAGFKVIKDPLHHSLVIVEAATHCAHVDVVEEDVEYPRIVLGVLAVEGAIWGGLGGLDQTKIGPDNRTGWISLSELEGPDTRACQGSVQLNEMSAALMC